jgi:hypothetical protein
VATAATVLAAEQQVLGLVSATMRRHRSLRALLAPAAEVHRAHTRLLRNAVPTDAPSPSGPATTAPRVPARSRRALAAVVAAEDRLTTVAKHSAFSAESGAFARVLASMAAACAQQASVLAQARPGAGR